MHSWMGIHSVIDQDTFQLTGSYNANQRAIVINYNGCAYIQVHVSECDVQSMYRLHGSHCGVHNASEICLLSGGVCVTMTSR